MIHNILMIDDNVDLLESMKNFLEDEGCFFVKAIENPDEGIALVRQKSMAFSLALIDYHMPKMPGTEVIRKIRDYDPKLPIIAFSGDQTDEVYNLTLKNGAIFFLSKETTDAKLLGTIYRICEEIERRREPIKRFDSDENIKIINAVGLTGVSNHLVEVVDLIQRAAQSDSTVFIRGENGSGKDVIANAIHKLSLRGNGPFIPVNCAAIPDTLIERELFGHEKGTFTGATSSQKGKFQAADGGTLFLDEIGDMKHTLQSTLLRVLQDKKVFPVGSNVPTKVNVRVIAATNAPIEDKILEGTFREDLFYRLNVLPITILPLRKRPEDIPLLAQAFVDQLNHDNKTNKILTPAVIDELRTYPWPGNVRQLKHIIERMVLLSSGRTLDTNVVAQQLKDMVSVHTHTDYEVMQNNAFQEEDRLIRSALQQNGYVISRAARAAHMSRSTFCDKMKRHEIDIAKLKPSEGA